MSTCTIRIKDLVNAIRSKQNILNLNVSDVLKFHIFLGHVFGRDINGADVEALEEENNELVVFLSKYFDDVSWFHSCRNVKLTVVDPDTDVESLRVPDMVLLTKLVTSTLDNEEVYKIVKESKGQVFTPVEEDVDNSELTRDYRQSLLNLLTGKSTATGFTNHLRPRLYEVNSDVINSLDKVHLHNNIIREFDLYRITGTPAMALVQYEASINPSFTDYLERCAIPFKQRNLNRN